jgi:mono/diheme cytochrome c family protein
MRLLQIGSLALLLPAPARAADPVDYTRDIKPLLAKHCVECHGADKQRSNLRLDTAAAALRGGKSGPAIVPKKSAESRLILAVTGADGVKPMPQKGSRLSDQQIALLRAWIDAGAPSPADEVASKPKIDARDHWAFRLPVRPAPPAVKDTARVRNPIDRFVLARLEKEQIAPSPEADRTMLIRRVSLDLIGLPPSPQEVDEFLADQRPDAYDRLVDRLLASPHYGERWGRHWLDLARYADSNGFSIDAPRSLWKYRDWVIDALNRDLPFDQFAIEQLAGDLLPNPALEQRIATGFHRNTLINQEGGIDEEQFRVESVVDRVNTTCSVFLGMTVGCAQCHDHKFDPISQREFYQLFAFFNNADEPTLELPTPEQNRKREEVRAKIDDLEKQLRQFDSVTPEILAAWEGSLTSEAKATLPANIREILALAPNGRSAAQDHALLAAFRKIEQTQHVVACLGNSGGFLPLAQMQLLALRQSLEKQVGEQRKHMPAIITTLVVEERKTPRETHIHLAGDFARRGESVKPATPSVLPSLPTREGLTRLDLAKWLVDPKNPLTARVTMNRVWQHYFGLGLVETENDFGTQGTPPTLPELLDWLATEFIARGWSVKAMHRLIVTSATYRQASRVRPELATTDPRNRLLARQNRLRLEAEVVRDAALTSSGLLTRKLGGPSVFPPQPQGVYTFTQIPRDWKPNTGPDRYRRGLYTYFWRSAPHPGLTVFDAPESNTTCTRRNRSNTPLQALTLLNDQAYLEFAQGLAARILAESHGTDDERLVYAFRLCLSREPSAREQQTLTQLLSQQLDSLRKSPDEARSLASSNLPKDADVPRYAAWTTVARVLLNLDEFISRE